GEGETRGDLPRRRVDAGDERSASVVVSRGPNGLIFTSPDPVALDRVMQLAEELSSSGARYHLFPLKHMYAKDMAELLTKIFSDAAPTSNNVRTREYYYFDEPPQKEQKERGRSSRRPPLKFVPDQFSNTVLVQGADDRQLAEIRSLI